MGLIQKIKYLKNLDLEIEEKQKQEKALKRKIKHKKSTIDKYNQNLNKKRKIDKNYKEKIENKKKYLETEKQKLRQENDIIFQQELKKVQKESENIIALSKKKAKQYKKKTINKNKKLINQNNKLQIELERKIKASKTYDIQISNMENFFLNYPKAINYKEIKAYVDETYHFYKKEYADTNKELTMQLHSENSNDLKQITIKIKANIKEINKKYSKIFKDMSEEILSLYFLTNEGFQNETNAILIKIKENNIHKSKENVRKIAQKYLTFALKIAPELKKEFTKYIIEIENSYIELIDIQYKYFIYKAKEKEEQEKIKEEIKQTKLEEKALKEEQEKIEKEESKFQTEIEKSQKEFKELKAKQALEMQELSAAEKEKQANLEKRIEELNNQLQQVETKKEEIITLTTGKAGYVYIISNLGSFGEDVFKIGMTRRLEPQQRVDELGSASVPFRFDVHALIFSDDASSLETQIHHQLDKQRVNKINPRKEFFRTNIEQLEQIVHSIDPTAEFTTTMLAEEYRQSLEIQ